MRLNALFRLAFAPAPSFSDLTSPHASNSSAHSSKGTPSGYRATEVAPATPSDCLWARGFRYCFTPLIGVLFTFPSRYSFTIGRQEYLALDGGPPGFPHERPSTWYSGTRPGVGTLSRTGLSPSLAGLSMPLLLTIRFVTPYERYSARRPALQHHDGNGCNLSRRHGLGFSAFARHYSRNVLCSSGYLDVSVPPVSSCRPIDSVGRAWA